MPLGRLRAHRRLIELQARDLVMTRSEATELLRASGLKLGPGAIKRLIERTEGWPAALYLAALSLEGENEPSLAIERLAGDDRLVADYLRDEFLSRQSAEDLDFLTATSVLSLASTLLLGIVGAAVLYVGTRQILAGSLTVGGLFTYTMLLGFLIAPVFQVVT